MATKKGNTKRRGASTTKKSKKKGGDKEIAPVGKHEAMIAEQQETTKRLYAAITESVEFMGERLRAGDDTRDVANSFLLYVSSRFDKIAKPNFHGRLGYDHNSAQIQSNLSRISQNLSRKTLAPDHGRVDTVLESLVDEVMRLAKSQSVFCEHCEHCLRERYTHGFDAIAVGEGFTTEATLDSKTWAHIVERFGWPDELGTSEIIVALRHIESLAWVGRAGGVKEAVTALVTALVKQSIDLDELREGYESQSLEHVKQDILDNEKTD